MAGIMSNAVDRVYTLLCLRDEKPEKYESEILFGEQYTGMTPVGSGGSDTRLRPESTHPANSARSRSFYGGQ